MQPCDHASVIYNATEAMHLVDGAHECVFILTMAGYKAIDIYDSHFHVHISTIYIL